MEEAHATPLPDTITESPKKTLSILHILLVILGILFILIVAINVYLYFANKSAGVSKTTPPKTVVPVGIIPTSFQKPLPDQKGTISVPCPVSPEYCKTGNVSRDVSKPEKIRFVGLGFLLPGAEPIRAVVGDVFYQNMFVANSPNPPTPDVKDKTVIGADFTHEDKRYNVTYIFEGAPAGETKKYAAGEEIGKMGGENKYTGIRRTFNISIRDLDTNVYLTPQVIDDGKTLVFVP